MPGLPEDFDGQMLIGRTLDQVCVALYQVILQSMATSTSRSRGRTRAWIASALAQPRIFCWCVAEVL
jgi:hypothetical protein